MPSLEAIEVARQQYGLRAEEYPDELFLTVSSLPEDEAFISDNFGSPLVQAAYFAELREQRLGQVDHIGRLALRAPQAGID